MSSIFRILCLGDVVGRPGRSALKQHLAALRRERGIGLIIANGENAAGGVGIDAGTADEIFAAGVDIITLGDHTWQKREFRDYLTANENPCIRPANYPAGAPGHGWTVWQGENGPSVGVMNLMGRVFIGGALDCPFGMADELIDSHLSGCDLIVCDFHAEATSEKVAMGRYLDGKVCVVFGTHTHVQTADEQILPGGTGYISDLGMCGVKDGVIGMDSEVALERFISGLPAAYKLAKGSVLLCGAIFEIDLETKHTVRVERLRVEAKADGES